MKPTLFLLQPDFTTSDETKRFCPECAMIEGVLSYYPEVKDKIDIQRIAFPRPRADLVAAVGEENQGAPVLVFAKGEAPPDAVAASTGRSFIVGPEAIVDYLAGAGLSGRIA